MHHNPGPVDCSDNVPVVEQVTFIKVTTTAGLGISGSPIRQITDYYWPDGKHLLRQDPYMELEARGE